MLDASTTPDPEPLAEPSDGRLRDGDHQAAIARLVAEHADAVFRYAFRLSGNNADAEDLTQQAFLVAHEKLSQLRDPSKVRAWLFTVLRSCFLKNCRKRTPTPAVNLELDVTKIPEDVPGDDAIDGQLLQAALDELPDEFRIVLVMFYFEDCSYKEIAHKLDLPIGTVMSRLSRAKSRLRHKLLAAASPVR